jgi:hypothetical protein
MILPVQLDPAIYAASVYARLPRRLGHRVPLRHPQHRLHPAKQKKVMGLSQSLAEATAILSGELRDTEPTPIHFLIVPYPASVAKLRATYRALLSGQATSEEMAQLACGTAQRKIPQLIQALEGNRMSNHLRFIIRSCLRHLACLEEEIEELLNLA